MPRQEKIQEVDNIKNKVAASQFIAVTDYRGLSVNEISDLRAKLSEAGCDYKVYKNTLFRIAIAEDSSLEGLNELLVGPTAVAFHEHDAVGAAKALMSFAEENDKLEIKGGVLASKVIGQDKIKYLVSLPSREQLLAKLAGTFKAPITALVGGLSAVPKKLVYALAAIRDSKQG
jgi:large subunit ribosomal protein L10